MEYNHMSGGNINIGWVIFILILITIIAFALIVYFISRNKQKTIVDTSNQLTTDQTAKPTSNTATNTVANPVATTVVNPVTNTVTNPVANTVTNPVANAAANPVANEINKPTAATEPVIPQVRDEKIDTFVQSLDDLINSFKKMNEMVNRDPKQFENQNITQQMRIIARATVKELRDNLAPLIQNLDIIRNNSHLLTASQKNKVDQKIIQFNKELTEFNNFFSPITDDKISPLKELSNQSLENFGSMATINQPQEYLESEPYLVNCHFSDGKYCRF